MAKIEDIQLGSGGKRMRIRSVVPPSETIAPLVSVDDHLLEPANIFENRLPQQFRARAPRIVRLDGVDHWTFEDTSVPLQSGDAMVTWEPEDYQLQPVSIDDVRAGTWNVDDRIKDMDIAGIAASLSFPSSVFGFCGHRFYRFKDEQLGLASLRAYNDWMIEEWAGSYPDRLISTQIAWLPDPEVAASDIYLNSERGCRALSFSENPEKLGLGLPSIHSKFWDPIFRACEETNTVLNLHVGSSSETFVPSSDSPLVVMSALFAVNGFAACADWACSRVPLQFPNLKIVMSEGGIGWVTMLLDRLKYLERRAVGGGGINSKSNGPTPLEVVHRNFWFTTFDDPTALMQRDLIGIDRILFESDYPHPDTSWPNTQAEMARIFCGLPQEDIEKIAYRNACALYRHTLPAS